MLCFLFLFRAAVSSFFIVPVVMENVKLKTELAILTSIPITVVKKAINYPSYAADRRVQIL